MRHAYTALVIKPEGRRALGRNGCKWKSNITMHLE
jgi:hypothetical protein